MKTTKIFTICALLASGILSGCSGDDDTSKIIVPAKIVEQSVNNGAEIDASMVKAINITYDCAISIADPSGITLNGSRAESSTSGKVLTITTPLQEGTNYTLAVKKGAVLADNGTSPEGITLQFKTKAKQVEPEPEPVKIAALTNSNATAEAKKLYDSLVEQYGKKTITGAMGAVAWELDFANHIEQVSGQYPTVVGFDYIHLAYSPCNWIDYSDITPVKQVWDAGSIPTMSWHWRVPDLTKKTEEDVDVEVKGNVVWQKTVVIGQDWSVWEQIPASTFETIKEGDELNIYLTADKSAAYNQLKSYVPCDTPDTFLECYDAIDEDTYHCVAISATQRVLTLKPTAKDIETLKAYGIAIGGYAITLQAISLSEPTKMGDAVVLASDTKVMPTDWSGWYKIEASLFANAKVGDVVTALTKDVASGAQGSFKDGSTWKGLVDGSGTNYDYFSITGDYTLTLDATLLKAIQSNGLIVSGHDYTLTGVTLTPTASNKAKARRTLSRANTYPAASLEYNTKGFHAANVVIEGTEENVIAKADVAEIAGYLKALQDAGIPVLFRPLHEAAGDYQWGAWFWWGYDGADACKALWKWLYETLTVQYGLNNLIWVWTVQTTSQGKLAKDSDLKNWYPGDEYVDIVGADLYEDKAGWSRNDAFELVKNSVDGKKMVALSECGNLPDLSKCQTDGAPWLYFMGWYDKINSDGSWSFFSDWNNETIWKSVMTDPYALNRGGLSGIK